MDVGNDRYGVRGMPGSSGCKLVKQLFPFFEIRFSHCLIMGFSPISNIRGYPYSQMAPASPYLVSIELEGK